MGGRGTTGTRNIDVERPINTSITKRQLKTHVTATLKAAGLTKAETYSTSIRGYRSVRKAGFDWGEEYGGAIKPYIVFVGGFRTTAERKTAYMDRVEAALSKDFKIRRDKDTITILGEYEKEKRS